jgi:hypothetical protein
MTATDRATEISAPATVNLVIPQITPAQATIQPNHGIVLQLLSPSGKELKLPPDVTWESNDPSETHLTRTLNPENPQSAYWSNKAPQTPGVVTIVAKYANGVPFSQATVTVDDNAGNLVIFDVYGGPMSPVAMTYSTTTVTTSEAGTTTQTGSDPNYHLVANFHDGPGSPRGYRMCKLGSNWIDASYSAEYTSTPASMPAECSGTPFHDHWLSNASVSGGSLHATFVADSASNTACDYSQGNIVNKVSSSQQNHQVQDYTINLESGIGFGSFNANLASSSTTTATQLGGMVKTSTVTDATTGGASGSWGPTDPAAPLTGTRITRSTLRLNPGDLVPLYCTSR